MGALIGGAIGSGVGAAIWVAVGYFLNAEVGYIAWGIGALAGIGVAAGSKNESAATGVVAVVCAVVAILGAKYMVVSMLVDKGMAEESMPIMDDESMIVRIADEVVAEREAAGQQVKWKRGMSVDIADEEVDYPAPIWAEAEKRWLEKPADERERLIAEENELMEEFAGALASGIKESAFTESFSPVDLLWFGLAAFTAFRIGSGATDD